MISKLEVVEIAAEEVFLSVMSELSQLMNAVTLTLLQGNELVYHRLQGWMGNACTCTCTCFIYTVYSYVHVCI